MVSMLNDSSAMQFSKVKRQCDTLSKILFLLNWLCQTLIRVISEEGTMASTDIALVCDLKFQVGSQDRLHVNSDADEAFA